MLAFASPASAQWGWPTDPQECTFIAGASQLSIAGSTVRTCGAMSHGTSVVVTDAIADDCSNVTGATGGGTGALVVQWDSSLGAAGEWKCPTVLPGGFTPNPSPSVNHSGFDAAADARIAAATKTGADVALVTGTAGPNGHCAEWDVNGDLVTAGAACTVPFLPNVSPAVNHTGFDSAADARADARIAATSRTGADVALVTGTAGSDAHCAQWNADGDLVTTGAACEGTPFSPNASPTFNHSAFNAEADARIAAATKTGLDAALVTGTAGSTGHCAEWDANGDLITAGAVCGGTPFSPNASPTFNHSAFNAEADARIAAATKTGLDAALVTGTAGSDTHCAQWNADGDLVTAGAACGVAGTTNAISQGNSNVTITDTGAGGKVEMDADGVLLLEILGATNEINIGTSSVSTDQTNILSDLTVNGVVTADGFTATQANGARGANFKENTSAYSCTAISNGFDIFADSTGVLDDLPLWCDQTPAVHEFTSHGVRGATPLNPRLSLIGVEDAPVLLIQPIAGHTDNIIEAYAPAGIGDLLFALDILGNVTSKRMGSTLDGAAASDLPWIVNENGIAKYTQLRFRAVNDFMSQPIGGPNAEYFDAAKLTITTDVITDGAESSSLVFHTMSSGTSNQRLTIPSDDPFTIAKGPTASTSGIKVAPFTGSGFIELNAPEIANGTETHVMRHKTVSFLTASATVATEAFRDGLVIVDSSTNTRIVVTLPTPASVGIGGNVCIVFRTGFTNALDLLEVKPDATSTIFSHASDGLTIQDGISAFQKGSSVCLVATEATSWQTINRKGAWSIVLHP
jgi:hypothetical protein